MRLKRMFVSFLLILCTSQLLGAILIPTPVRASVSSFVSVKDGHFWVDGKRLYLNGVNYWPWYAVNLSDGCRRFWLACDYRNTEVATDLDRIKNMGMNL